jgi:hypothetical protein
MHGYANRYTHILNRLTSRKARSKEIRSSYESDDAQLVEALRNFAQQIWQAGLGAFAEAQEEDDKEFHTLIKEGVDLQKRTQKRAQSKETTGGADTASRKIDTLNRQASGARGTNLS